MYLSNYYYYYISNVLNIVVNIIYNYINNFVYFKHVIVCVYHNIYTTKLLNNIIYV